MTRLTAVLLLAVVAGGASGCGTTTIHTSEPSARVLADGQVLGRGQGRLTRRGFPGTTNVVVKTDDGRQGEMLLRRQFTALTLVLGLFTYGVCLVACWEYPDAVLVTLPGGPPVYGSAPAGPTPASVDPWLAPPEGWQPKPNQN